MASYDSQPRSRSVGSHLAVALAAGCCLLGAAPLSTAAAKGRAVPNSTSTSTGGAGEEADQSSGSEAAAATPSADGSTTGEGQPQAPVAGAGSEAKAVGQRHARPDAGSRARRRSAGKSARETSAPSEQAPSGQSLTAARVKKEKGGGKKEKSSNKGKKGKATGGKSTQDPGSQLPEDGESGKGSSAGNAAAATVASVTAPASEAGDAVPGATAATTGSTKSAQLGLTKDPAISSKSVRGATLARARRARKQAVGPSLAAGSVLAAAAGAAAPATTATGATGRRTAADKGRRSQTPLAPLVTTVTKIVGVVPTALRVLIAALAALALALAVRSRLTARRARRLERQRGQLLEDVGLLQAALLPAPPARIGPVGTSVAYRPAEGPGAGGDFYDVFALEDGQLAVIVGDVSGHGRGALPHTALLRFTIRAYLEAGLSPRRALQTAGSVLERQLGGSFATVVAGTYHPRERTLTYSCAGHPPPVVLGSPAAAGKASAIAPVTACSSPPIGIGVRTGMRQTVVSVPGPAQICFYTDGVTEARVGGELYGDARLACGLRELGAGASASSLLERVAQDTDARPDDMAACVLSVQDGSGEPSILHEELELDREESDSGRPQRFLHACGIEPWEAAEVMQSALADAATRDPVMLELQFEGGMPSVALRQDNVVHPAALVAARTAQVHR